MQTEENFVKIQFRFYSDVLEQDTVETMWAEIMDEPSGIYILDSIPFYAPNLASGDVISAAYDEQEKILVYKETISCSGNSTVQVVMMDQTVPTNDLRDIFKKLGCITEKFKEGYFVIEVPADVNYSPVRAKLNELTKAGIIDYAEPCLSGEHGNASS
jgi:hypothetical protein